MEINLRNRIWPEYTGKWFKSERDSSVPHNFNTTNIKANDNIKRYLLDNGLLISSNWVPDEIFHEHFKRWVGYCSAPYHTLQDNTPTQPFWMSFFPFVFEVASAFFLGNFDSYITQTHFLENGDTIVINPKEPKVVQLCLKGILDRLLHFEDPKYGFVYLVLINNNNQSNIDAMKIEDNGEFWVRLKIELTDQMIEKINDRYACVTSDRAMKIQELKTYLASADSFVQLDVENRDDNTYLVFKQKTKEQNKIPLNLLNGFRLNFEEKDTCFSVGCSGGTINTNVCIDVKVEHDGLEKLNHLLSTFIEDEKVDISDISYADLVQCIKKPIISICANLFKQHDYKTVCLEFDSVIKSHLETKIVSEMRNLFGLRVDIKSINLVEVEDASRLRELSARSQKIKFGVIPIDSGSIGVGVFEFQSAFKVVGLDMDGGWDAFVKFDFGYRNNSLARMKFIHKDDVDHNYDRKCKKIAIDNELNCIGEEIERNIKANLELIPNLYTWYRDAIFNRTIQEALLAEASLAIKQSRGLVVNIENIIIDDERLIKRLKKERDREYEFRDSSNIQKNKIISDNLEGSVKRKAELENSGKKSSESNQKSINHGTVIHGGNFTNVIVGDHNKQFNDSKSGDDEE